MLDITDEQRDEVARIIEQVAKEGLPHPRNLDAAIDAILCSFVPVGDYKPGDIVTWAHGHHAFRVLTDDANGLVMEDEKGRVDMFSGLKRPPGLRLAGVDAPGRLKEMEE